MSNGSNATGTTSITQRGVVWGFVGVLAFSFSLPATRVAVEDLDATFVGLGRALVAAALAAAFLLATRAPRPARKDLPRFLIVGLGVVIGFPLFTSLALKHLESAHASVVVGLLPAATAVFAVLRANERPSKAFWLSATAGLVAVLAFAATQGVSGIAAADLLVLAAVASAGLGYAEGGALSRTYGGPQTISWALLVTAPFLIVPVALAAREPIHADAEAWLGFAYVSAVSMFLGFFAWYRGLALGGVAKIGQTQLVQPVLTLIWSALLLNEHVTAAMVVAALAVVACVLATQRTRASAQEGRAPVSARRLAGRERPAQP
ncbi:DMT family transporter [Solirubrobacter sp. CPCC 204708]|uniref:DMT family transporter n=1 Tax=Solirubrobacter deserti TaxID=2282478 RepID=A0ABT4RIW0_9ACTN|nr:DMT family transporter [Solirubrobacter deserti]MBE2320847.1 DMT family transporter [Solirubrobacter deserti]MDA0138481.1 DMT family transporter [Solirubrobacter deserti]